jgi:outer membrane protein assembly factor BamB
LYVLGSVGRVRCLDPDTGAVRWTFDLGAGTYLSSDPAVAASRSPGGERRRIYFGAGLNYLTFPGVFCLEDK